MKPDQIETMMYQSLTEIAREVGRHLASQRALSTAAFAATLESEAKRLAVDALSLRIKLELLAQATKENEQ